jgi:hypothetical protein
MAPLVGVFLLAEWLLRTGSESFTLLLSLGGALVASVVAGFFPVLLLIAGEKKSDFVLRVAQWVPRNRVVQSAVYLLFLAGLLLHGLVLWDGPARLAALLVAGLILGATVIMFRHGAFASRLVVRVQQDAAQGGRVDCAVIRAGRPERARLQLEYIDGTRELEATHADVPRFGELRSLTFELHRGDARDLRLWVNRVTTTGDVAPLPAVVEASGGREPRHLDLEQSAGQALLPLDGSECRVTIRFPGQSSASRRQRSAFLAI